MKRILITMFALATTTLSATTITVSGVDGTRGGSMTFQLSSADRTGYVGVILGTYESVNVAPLFCVDVFTPIGITTYNSVPLAPNPLRNEDRVAWLYQNMISTVNSVTSGQAFQLAIWDIIHDGGDGVAAGAVQSATTTAAGVITAWQNYLTASVGMSSLTGVSIYENTAIGTGTPAQNLIGALVTPSAVPEPSTWAMLASGLVAAGFLRRRA